MADWNDLRAYVKKRCAVTFEGDDGSLVVKFRGVSDDPERTQKIAVCRWGPILDSDWAEISTPVCLECHIDPADALRRNAGMTVGFLALVDGVVRLVYRFPLADVQASEIDKPLQALAVYGDELEQELTGRDVA
jgi:hypothetical protein